MVVWEIIILEQLSIEPQVSCVVVVFMLGANLSGNPVRATLDLVG